MQPWSGTLQKTIRAQPGVTTLVMVALYFFASVVAGLINSYTPVPFWDSWAGIIGFYVSLDVGEPGAWWRQHNEHRIFLSRILFWLDLKLAGGSSVLLLISHVLLIALAVYLFVLFSRRLLELPKAQQRQLDVVVGCLATIWLFRWIQAENIAWAFQSQFFMAQTLPLLALYLQAKASIESHQRNSQLWFAAACLVGAASAGTMANGIICLPLMLCYSLLARQSWRRSLLLLALSAAVLMLYFSDYRSPPSHGSVLSTLLNEPLQLAHYVLLYLGTPFFYLLNGSNAFRLALLSSLAMAAISISFLLSTVNRLWKNEEEPDINKIRLLWQLALVFYIIYLAGTALGTGGGRLTFGLNQALTQRYTTPAMMAWAATFLLTLPWIYARWNSLKWPLTILGLLVLIPLIDEQHKAWTPQYELRFERALAALALELEVADEARINAIYELSPGLLQVVDSARRRQLSVFGKYPWQGLRIQLHNRVPVRQEFPPCIGHVDQVTAIDKVEDFVLVRGWLLDGATYKPAQRIRVTDDRNIIRGFALGGGYRPDVASESGLRQGRKAGFAGYISTEVIGQPLTLIAEDYNCALNVNSLAVN